MFNGSNSVKAFLIAIAVSLAGFAQLHATNVKLDFLGVKNNAGVYTGGNNVSGSKTTRGGQFEWNVLPGGTSSLTGLVKTYCLNINYTLIDPDFYTLTSNLASLPTPGGVHMGAMGESKLRILANEIGSGFYVASREAIQIAVWKIVNATVGGFNLSSSTSGVNTEATNLLTYIDGKYAGGYNYAGITWVAIGLDSGSGQDQLMWTNNPQLINEVPVPAGIVMAGLGVIFAGGFNYLRRRKTVVTA